MRLPFALAALVLLPGCFGMCGFSPDGAHWEDPALFQAMPAPGIFDGAASVWTPPEPGLPFTTVVDASWGPTNLTVVQLTADAGVYDPVRVSFTPAGLGASRVNATSESVVAAAAHAFLENATTLSAPDRADLVEALLASRHEEDRGYQMFGEDMVPLTFVGYGVPLPGGLRLDALYAELQQAGEFQVGLGGAQAGPWGFGFSQAKKTLDADGGHLQVGPTGVAEFMGLGKGERDDDDYERDLRAWLDEQGLPQPATLDVHGSIC